MKDNNNITLIKNSIANCFKILSIFVILLGILFIVFNFFITYKENLFSLSFIINIILYIFSIAIVFFLFRAIAEIIQLLEDIKNK